MTVQPPLIPDCPLPGCHNVTEDPRRPCPDCVAALGGYLQPAEVAVTAEEFAAASEAGSRRVAEVMAERARARQMEAG